MSSSRAVGTTGAVRLVVGPFNRVEGDLEVQLDIADGHVREARVTAPMYRGFETLLEGRSPHDALVIVPRICGICSVSQSLAAARALAGLAGVAMPPNGRHAINLMAACENLADHLTHFYLFFMPDFARAAYAGRPWHARAVERFAAGAGSGARQALAARTRWFHLMGTLGGKWPHTQSVLPGGSSRAIDTAERLRLGSRLREFRQFLEESLYGGAADEVGALGSEAALAAWRARPGGGDLRLFLDIADDLGLAHAGRGPGLTMSSGAYPQPDGSFALAPGVWDASAACLEPLDAAAITEDSTHAWLGDDAPPRHPSQGLTVPHADKPGAYTWNKAPRLAGRVVETGALARQLADGQPLLRDAVARSGASVRTRVLARAVEVARVLTWMEAWLQAIVPREPFHAPHARVDEGQAAGFTEAARGTLGHWLRVGDGRIALYQIVAPTSWNFSPRDAAGVPGALEAALVGTPVAPGETTPVAVQHVVRSFDPCMVCTVH